MEKIEKTIQIVERTKQNSLMLTDRDSQDSINSLKDDALLKLGESRVKPTILNIQRSIET